MIKRFKEYKSEDFEYYISEATLTLYETTNSNKRHEYRSWNIKSEFEDYYSTLQEIIHTQNVIVSRGYINRDIDDCWVYADEYNTYIQGRALLTKDLNEPTEKEFEDFENGDMKLLVAEVSILVEKVLVLNVTEEDCRKEGIKYYEEGEKVGVKYYRENKSHSRHSLKYR